jgi:ornithine cyclodeaminase
MKAVRRVRDPRVEPGSPPWIDAAAVRRLLPPGDAMAVLEESLLAADLAAEPPRQAVPLASGQLLVMPSTAGGLGVKIVTVSERARPGWPRIQSVYVLFDADSLAPAAFIDGTALTALRTPAVSALAASRLMPARTGRLVVFGTGPQAVGHVEAITAVRPVHEVVIVGRTLAKASELAGQLAAAGAPARPGTPAAVEHAEAVVCATTSAEPLFDSAAIRPGCCVIAVGSHEPGKRELDAALLGRSMVVVEDVPTALREAGDVIAAIAAGTLTEGRLTPLADLVAGRVLPDERHPRVFKSVGMAWQDLAVAREIYARSVGEQGRH